MSADSASIGGPGRADSLDGVVSPRCDHAIDQAQRVGLFAVTFSVRSFLRVPSYLRSLETIDRLIGWPALPLGTGPNRGPWGRLDLAELSEAAEAMLGPREVSAYRPRLTRSAHRDHLQVLDRRRL